MPLETLLLLVVYLVIGVELLNIGMRTMRRNPARYADMLRAADAGHRAAVIPQLAFIATWPFGMAVIALSLLSGPKTYP